MKKINKESIILGAGITGLTAGYKSGLPIFEAEDGPGGICASYYIKSGRKVTLMESPADNEAYRFEIGGGHWIFGADAGILRFIRALTPVESHTRLSSVYFSKNHLRIPYPIQHNVKLFDRKIADKIVKEMQNISKRPSSTLKEWLASNFGPTLCELFFYKFHDLYTAGLFDRVVPQNQYKSPAKNLVQNQGTCKKVGYNAVFIYPKKGLNKLIQAIARKCNISYNQRVVKINIKHKQIYFADHGAIGYKNIISTLPLNKIIEMTGLYTKAKPDPYTSVLVVNIGAIKGENCPNEHWLYVPDSISGFFRVGIYSNVDTSFLPRSSRKTKDKVSIYVERAFMGGCRPSEKEIKNYLRSVVKELQNWGFIKEVEVIDQSWIDVAYTWSWLGSTWREDTLRLLRENNIYQIGRYGRWKFQGIAESLKEALSFDKILRMNQDMNSSKTILHASSNS